MYTRLLNEPPGSFFLFGPLGTGKSTWIREHFHNTTIYNLLDSREALKLERDPHALYDELKGPRTESWVVLDAVVEEIDVLPVRRFLEMLWQGEIIR